jgi:hypothetical protein
MARGAWLARQLEPREAPADGADQDKPPESVEQSSNRQYEPNELFRSGLAASASRSGVFAAHGRERRWRGSVLPAAA